MSITLSSPLPPEKLHCDSISSAAALSTLGEIQLGLHSTGHDIKPDDLLGKAVTVKVEFDRSTKRYFHGYVTRFGMSGGRGTHGWTATVRPWLWFLTRTSDCRIFQNLSVPDIVKKVFGDHPIANFEFKLFRSYQPWVYCVQYRESDYNFVARLLEHEGIYWYFEHSNGAHKLVLVDASSSHDPVAPPSSLHYNELPERGGADPTCISHWTSHREVRTGKTVLTSYDFERPSTSLEVDHDTSAGHDQADHEQFDYQGDYVQASAGTQWAKDRAEEHQSRLVVAHGSSNAPGLAVGHTFEMTRHAHDNQNGKYLVTSLNVHAHEATDASGGGDDYHCDFACIPAAQQFRPTRRTPKPFVQGPQTAVVVGPSGEEIFTDKYGRVKVQFHWDRYGKNDEKSGCWVRVSQPWAGKNFGFMHIPRIGQEVVVDFLEGDPDQPLITGRVYNAEQMPPWDLPANATQSGVLSRSSQGGSYGNANALRFEDKKGSEQLWLHAEKNQDIEVENDETHWVGHDRTKTVDHDETTHVKHDRTETVDNNETITIGVNRTEMVGSNESITIGSNRSITVGGSETATVAMQRTHAVGVNESIAIGAAQEIAIGAAQMVAVGAAQSITVGANQSTSVGASQSNSIGADQTTSVGANRSIDVGAGQTTSVAEARTTSIGKDDSLSVGKNLSITAADSITLTTGSASITMKKDGTITIKGKDITIDGSGKINVKAGGDVVMKGSKILQN